MRPHGRAVIGQFRGRALAECDRCGFVRNHRDLKPQMKQAGMAVIETGWMVCDDCLDPIDVQQRPVNTGLDGQAVPDPRPTDRSYS